MSSFVANLHAVFRHFGPIEARRMFGGHGIYHDGRMIGLVADDVLYLKSDPQSAPHFDARALAPFMYTKQGRTMALSYRQAPDEIFDDADEAVRWARMAFEAALRSGQAPKAGRKNAAGAMATKAAGKSAAHSTREPVPARMPKPH